MTMSELGEQLAPPVTLATIAKLETSQMGLTLDYMIQIAKILKVSVCDLVDDVGPERMVENRKSADPLSVPLRSGVTAEISNLPFDLTASEARRLANVVIGYSISNEKTC